MTGGTATGGVAAGGPATGGATTGGVTTGVTGIGGAPMGGTTSGGSLGTGCNSSLEAVQTPGSGLCVANLVTIAAPSGHAPYGIDATEVTQGQYWAWLETNPLAPATNLSSCTTNTTLAQNTQCLGEMPVCTVDCDHKPVVCVDWCDAYAYCEAVGKRLCGAIGGGANTYFDIDNVYKSQWYRACVSGDQKNDYPYGELYDRAACNGADYPHLSGETLLSVGAATGCQSRVQGYGGVFELSGHVWEWEDACDSSASDAQCRLRGGSYFSGGAFMTCSIDSGSFRNVGSYDFGFRCCSL